MDLNFRWIFWQVVLPLGGPAVLAAIVVGAWTTLDPSFQVNWTLAIDFTPWATTFFCITLVGSTMDALWDKMIAPTTGGGSGDWGRRFGLFIGLGWVAFAVAFYNALMLIARHRQGYTIPSGAWIVTAVLLLISIVVSHQGHKLAK